MSYEDQSISTTLLSAAAVLRMLRQQGITDLETLVERSLALAEEAGQKDDEPPVHDIFISSHYVYVYSEPAPATTLPPHP